MKYSEITWTLASGSSRRLALLRQVGINPSVIVPEVEEIENSLDPINTTLANANKKAAAVKAKVADGLLLAADTIVVIDRKILGKPVDISTARSQLTKLSDNWHEVITGYHLERIQYKTTVEDYTKTRVHFRRLKNSEIEEYIETGEPFDKAGGYGIQGAAAHFVDRIEGCYFNVVGLPLADIISNAQKLINENSNR